MDGRTEFTQRNLKTALAAYFQDASNIILQYNTNYLGCIQSLRSIVRRQNLNYNDLYPRHNALTGKSKHLVSAFEETLKSSGSDLSKLDSKLKQAQEYREKFHVEGAARSYSGYCWKGLVQQKTITPVSLGNVNWVNIVLGKEGDCYEAWVDLAIGYLQLEVP